MGHYGQKELWVQSCSCAQILDARTLLVIFLQARFNLKLSSRKWEMEIEVDCYWVSMEICRDLQLMESRHKTRSDDIDGFAVSGLSCTYAT